MPRREDIAETKESTVENRVEGCPEVQSREERGRAKASLAAVQASVFYWSE
jgi:hypothetical protein